MSKHLGLTSVVLKCTTWIHWLELRLTAWLEFESLIIIFCFILKCNSNCATTKAKWKTGEATKLALLPMLNENSSLWKNDDI